MNNGRSFNAGKARILLSKRDERYYIKNFLVDGNLAEGDTIKKTITSLRKSLDKILESVEAKERSMMKKKENSL